MRNLKRALSLALASVMLLGMMVVGTSAASYTDVDEKDNVEAIEVLNAVNVMIGRQGNFEPDEPVNRHEMAVIMAKLVLGVETADNYVGSHPFTDVVPWADKYVAACYENGLVSGTSATTYGGSNPLTAVQAAAMMLRALGYEDLSKGATDWRAPVTAAANRIRLFDGVASNPSEKLDRNQVAQLALNTLKSPVVDTKQGLNITGSNGDYTFTVNGDREYTARSSSKAFAKAIDATEAKGTSASSIGGYTIELGEHLYNGDLKLYNDRTDVFGRPSRRWEYDGKEIGTYAKDELLRAEYTSEVTGRELYDLLGSSVVRDSAINVTIDGVSDSDIDGHLFNETAINRNNRAGVGGTGNGVLTQVYVDPNKGADGTVDITIINTYLAFAAKDYDAKRETLDLDVYGLDKKSGGDLVKTITANEDVETLKVSSEDFAVEDVEEDDPFLVTVADGAIQTMKSVEPMSAVEITSFQARKPADLASGNLTTGGKKYSFSSAAEYDNDCLKVYTDGSTVNLKDTSYDVYLDNYDNVIGVVEVDKATNYVFITGVDSGSNNLATTVLKANAIFLDGTMKEIEIDRNNSKSVVNALAANHQDNSTFNKWCTYSVSSSDVYSLTLVAVDGALTAAGQTHTTSGQKEINNKHLSIANANGTLVYGNNKSVYLSASVDEIQTIAGRTDCIIDGVDSVTTGIDNVDIEPLYGSDARSAADDDDASAKTISEGVYTLYDKKGWIIAMVVIGEDAGKNSDLVYVHNASVAQEYYLGSDGYKWTRTVIIDGVEEELVEVNDTRISMLQQMDANNWYRVKTNNDGEVTSIDGAYDKAIDDDGTKYNEDKDSIGNWNFTLSTKTAYAKSYANYVTAVRDAGVDTILYHEAFKDKKPSASGQTLYVSTGTDSGVRFAEDVKVVLDQINANKRETEFYSGETGLKNALRDLHENAKGSDKYNYEISAVIEGPYATSIVIKDLVKDGDSGTTDPKPTSTGAKAAIDGAADTTLGTAASPKALTIAYLTEDQKPVTAADFQAVAEEWAKTTLKGATLADWDDTSNPVPNKCLGWVVKNAAGAKLGYVTIDTENTGGTVIVQGVRVINVDANGDPTGNGYEIEALDVDSDTGATAVAPKTNDAFKKTTTNYAKYDAGKGVVYAKAKAENIIVTGHDWKIYPEPDAKVTLDGKTYYGTAGTTLIAGTAAQVTSGAAAIATDARKSGTSIETIAANKTVSHVAYSAATTMTDGMTYNTGYIKITDNASVKGVTVNNVAVTSDTGYYVPAGSAVVITLADSQTGKFFQASDADGKIGAVTEWDTTKTISTTVKAKDVTVGEVKKLTLPAAIADVGTTGMTLAWSLNGQSVSGDVYVSTTDKLKATVTFGAAFTDADDGAADTLTAAATGATIKATLSNAVGTAAAGVVTLVTTEIPANSTIEFEFTGATANPTITYAAKS